MKRLSKNGYETWDQHILFLSPRYLNLDLIYNLEIKFGIISNKTPCEHEHNNQFDLKTYK